MLKPNKKIVVFVLSHGHAGSTLLGNVLGTHPGVIHLGEIVDPIDRGREILCYHCGNQPCPVWDSVVQPDFVLECHKKFRNTTNKRRLHTLTRFTRKTTPGYKSAPGELFTRVFQNLPDIDIIIDSSKNIEWAEWNRHNTNYIVPHISFSTGMYGHLLPHVYAAVNRYKRLSQQQGRKWRLS